MEYGLNEGIEKTAESIMDLGKSFTGIFTGKFNSIEQAELVTQKNGILEELSNVISKSIKGAKGNIDSDLYDFLKDGKAIITKSLDESVNNIIKEQKDLIKDIDKYINNWEKAKTEKDIKKMQIEYEKIENKLETTELLEETKDKIKEIDNLHKLILNNGNNFNLSDNQVELAKIL